MNKSADHFTSEKWAYGEICSNFASTSGVGVLWCVKLNPPSK